MNKSEFMKELKRELKKRNVSDIPEILADYEEHFTAAIDEKTEQEIIEELGSVSQIADEYAANRQTADVNANNGQVIIYKNAPRPHVGLFVLLIVFDVIFGIAIASVIFSLAVAFIAVMASCIVGGGIWTVASFYVFGAVAIKFAGLFVSLAVMILGVLAAFAIKPIIKSIILLCKQYGKLHVKVLGIGGNKV